MRKPFKTAILALVALLTTVSMAVAQQVYTENRINGQLIISSTTTAPLFVLQQAGAGKIVSLQSPANTEVMGVTAAGLVATYNGVATAGGGLPSVVYNTAPAAGTASVAATTMVTPSAAGNYRLSGYVTQSVLGTSCTGNTTVALNAIFTDPNAAAAQTVAVDTFTVTTNGTLGQVSGNAKIYTFRSKASAAIQFSTTYTLGTACSPGPTVQIFPVLEALY